MSNAPVDNSRRRFLTVATSVVGGVGVVGAAIPFVGSWNPSERAKAAGADVEVDISKIQEGQMITVEWRGKPVYVLKRPQTVVDSLGALDDQLKDPQSEAPQQPDFAANTHRSLRPEFLVLTAVCTHLGCAPKYYKDGAFAEVVEGVPSGFFCPCHGSKFDMAGRVFKGVPAGANLEVPPYQFVGDATLIIGSEEEAA